MSQPDTEFRTPLVAEIKRLRKRVAELEAKQREPEGISRGSVEGLMALLRTIPDIFFRFAADGTFIDCQSNDIQGMLLPPAEFLGKRPEDVLPPELAAETTRCLKQVLSSGEIQTQEYSLQVNDELHHYESRMVPVGNGEAIAIVRDNTERKQAEEVLRDSEEYLRALSDASFEAIFLSEKGICLGQNSTAQAMFGYTPEEAVGRLGTDWIVPEDRDRVRDNMSAGREDYYEATALRRDGTTFAAELQARMIEHQGRQVRVTALRDITERKRTEEALRDSEKKLRAVLEAVPDLMIILDADGQYLNIYATEKDLLIAPSEQLIGKTTHEVMPARDAELIQDVINKALSTGELQQLEYSLDIDGARRWFSGRAAKFNYQDTDCVLWSARDITERKQTEEALRKSEAGLAKAQEIGHLGSWETNWERNERHWSDEIYRICGLAPQQFSPSYEAYLDAVHPADREYVDRAYMDSVKNGIPYEIVHRILRGDGSVRTVREQCEHVLDGAGNVIRSLGTTLDITDIKRAEDALREKERFHEALLNDMLTFVGILDLNGDVIFINNTPLKVGGLELQDVIGKKFYDAPWWTPRDEVRETIKRDVTKCAAGESLVHDVQIRTADGALMWIEFHMHPVRDEHGAVKYLVPEGRDITERKQVEEERERLTHAIEQAAESIVITDSEGLIQYINPAFEQTTGYTCEEAIGQNPRIIKSSKHDAAFYDDLWKTITDGEIWRGRLINKKKDGTLYTEEATISPVRDPSGKTTNYIAVKRDITREDELEAQLRQAQKMDSLGTLAGGIAHDFNNILSPILGYADMAMDILSEDSKAHKYCKEVLNASQRAAELVEQILLFSRQAEQEEKLISLHPAVNQALKLLRASFPSTSAIESRIGVNCGTVLGDPTQIHQIVMNLCTNAHQALPKTGGVIQVTLEAVTLNDELECLGSRLSSGEYVCLSVCDNGHGVDEATMERMFEPFFTTKDVGKGTGLGLSIVHGIISHHGGGITVDSEVGKGTTITAYFPRSADHSSAERPLSRTHSDGRDARVLIVDDEPCVAGMDAEMLRNLNYKVTVETSSVLALERFRNTPHGFDLVLSDLVMPGMTGDQMVKEMLAIRPQFPVVIMTGCTDRGIDEIGKNDAVWEYVKKPIVMNTLADAIEKALDGVNDNEEASR